MRAIARYYSANPNLLPPRPPVRNRFSALLAQALQNRAVAPAGTPARIPLQAAANAPRPPGQSPVNPARAVAMRNAAVARTPVTSIGALPVPAPVAAPVQQQATRNRFRSSIFS